MTDIKKAKAKLVRKVTIGGINGVRGGFKNVVGRTLVMTILGVASSYKTHTSETMDDSQAFSGEFRAVNADGLEYVGPVCFVPEPAQGLLKAALDSEDTVSGVEFGFEFYIVEDATAVRGYVYETVSLLDPAPSTAVAALAQRVGVNITGTPALPAPTPETDALADPAPQLGNDAAKTPTKPASKK